MGRTPATFKQADVVRAVKAAIAAGLEVFSTEIAPNGAIRLVHRMATPGAVGEFDRWEAEL